MSSACCACCWGPPKKPSPSSLHSPHRINPQTPNMELALPEDVASQLERCNVRHAALMQRFHDAQGLLFCNSAALHARLQRMRRMLQAVLAALEEKAKPFLNRSAKDLDSQVLTRRQCVWRCRRHCKSSGPTRLHCPTCPPHPPPSACLPLPAAGPHRARPGPPGTGTNPQCAAGAVPQGQRPAARGAQARERAGSGRGGGRRCGGRF